METLLEEKVLQGYLKGEDAMENIVQGQWNGGENTMEKHMSTLEWNGRLNDGKLFGWCVLMNKALAFRLLFALSKTGYFALLINY